MNEGSRPEKDEIIDPVGDGVRFLLKLSENVYKYE
jgi:hypothetical protein